MRKTIDVLLVLGALVCWIGAMWFLDSKKEKVSGTCTDRHGREFDCEVDVESAQP